MGGLDNMTEPYIYGPGGISVTKTPVKLITTPKCAYKYYICFWINFRMYDPHTDIVTAEWHPFRTTSWVYPLLTQFSDMRNAIIEEKKIINDNYNGTNVAYIVDFPGQTLENYIHLGISSTIEVVLGEIMVKVPDRKIEILLREKQKTQVRQT